ncbi:MAG TPA: hypothetical protein ENF70_04810 [Deltaproteobacteria bacterium]|nr:hypothetical protein [Deltaproteobacteria bacterium]HDH98432.1 hypothetical protein [Deltaproteobacteria bacterium]
MKNKSEGTCELCGHYVSLRQKAHIVAEGKKRGANLLMLCPTCHIMFDTHVKPKIYKALVEAGVEKLPESWKKSIYQQAAEASQKALKKKGK